MSPLTERLITAFKHSDNILLILRGRLKNKSKLHKIFIIEQSLKELKELYYAQDIYTMTMVQYIEYTLKKYLKGILHEN